MDFLINEPAVNNRLQRLRIIRIQRW